MFSTPLVRTDLEIPNQIPHLQVKGVGEDLEGAEGHALPAGFDSV